ncbi:hypothetical protein [Mesorhizobium sp.]|uniref:hypothetical protein n=1 Tax=Mesorhizobium sp. TaxID=1871066 RepID=UPI0025BF2B2C|nr:hypothetical protein [Mesorhizobium sp.]
MARNIDLVCLDPAIAEGDPGRQSGNGVQPPISAYRSAGDRNQRQREPKPAARFHGGRNGLRKAELKPARHKHSARRTVIRGEQLDTVIDPLCWAFVDS